jgi:hypothetical protein
MKTKSKKKYLLNVNGKRFKANTYIGLTINLISNKTSK